MKRALDISHLMLAGVIAFVVLFTNLGGPRLWDRDEPRNAGCAREMLERGDWVTPVFNGELRNHKPVLLYWLIMAAYSVFGVSEFAARFGSAALGTGTALLICGMGRHLFSARAGLWAAVALATSLMFGVAARAATPDSLLIFCSTLGLYFYVRRSLPSASARAPLAADYFPRSFIHAALIYGSFALGVLAKGPVALVLPTAIIGAHLLVAHRGRITADATRWQSALRFPGYFLWTCWRMRPITAMLMVLLIAAPWYLWVGLRTDGKFLWEFFVEHNLNRARQPMEGHDGPFFYYMLALLPGFFPWSAFLVPTVWQAVAAIRRREPTAIAILFCASWIIVWIGAFSTASTKLPSYVTPCYPALALLTGYFLDRWMAQKTWVPQLWPRLAIAVLAVAGIGLIITLPIVAQIYLPSEQALAIVGLIPLGGAGAAALMLRANQPSRATASLAAAAMVFSIAMFAIVAERVDRYQQSDRLLSIVAAHGAHAQLGAYGCLEPSWVFYGQRPVRELNDVGEFLRSGNQRFVITTRRQYSAIRERLPHQTKVLAEAPYFLKDEQLVLLGYGSEARTARR